MLWTGAAFAASVPEERRITHREKTLLQYEPYEADKLWERIPIPPSPALTPGQALQSFQLAPGFRIECVASEPLVEDPVTFEFDPDGRIWAVEMRGWMRDIDGTGEADPICRVVVLEDTDGDRFMDKSTPFLEGLVMPRTLSFVHGGVLIGEPPHLWYCEDLDGDLVCDRKREVGEYGVPGNPEHEANGLYHAIDNWMYNADVPLRHKWTDGELIEDRTYERGQWGMTQDDQGRLMFSYENRSLFADLVPSHYLYRNKNYHDLDGHGNRGEGAPGIHQYIGQDANEVFPIRVTPGITLGANELREDGTLRTFTISCGPTVYRGDQFPEECYGNVFIPEAAGNLVRRDVIESPDGVHLRARNAYDRKEFLASTDERFRPVNSRTGPDGALYICDLYHGIIEHVIFMMPYLRNQILSRGLDQPPDLGRIYRVVHEGKPLGPNPRMSAESAAELVRHLSHPNGWWRDTSQRLLVERRNPSSVGPLKELAAHGPDPKGQMHALWTLEGMGELDWATVRNAFQSDHTYPRMTAIRLAERFLEGEVSKEAVNLLLAEISDVRPAVRLQLLFTLGEIPGEIPLAAMANIVSIHREKIFQGAAISGLEGRELEFLEILLKHPDWEEADSGAVGIFKELAKVIVNEGDPKRMARLLDLAGLQYGTADWRRTDILEGVIGSRLAGEKWPEPIQLTGKPSLLAVLEESTEESDRKALSQLLRILTFPGDPHVRPQKPVTKPMSPEQEARRRLGSAFYAATCLACHEADGRGKSGQAPPLVDSEWVTAEDPDPLIRIVLHGLHGPIQVGEETWNLQMPAQGHNPILNDERIAGILTYIRREWGHVADPVDPEQVAEVKSRTERRFDPWTVAELRSIHSVSEEAIAAASQESVEPVDLMAKYAQALEGGDPVAGERIFHTKRDLQCIACHVVGKFGGGFVGPDLTEVGNRSNREYLLESLMLPSARIVEGYQTVVAISVDGEPYSGTLVSESDQELVISPVTGGTVALLKDDIADRFDSSLSSMPPVASMLSVEEVCDLIAYLESLRGDKED